MQWLAAGERLTLNTETVWCFAVQDCASRADHTVLCIQCSMCSATVLVLCLHVPQHIYSFKDVYLLSFQSDANVSRC